MEAVLHHLTQGVFYEDPEEDFLFEPRNMNHCTLSEAVTFVYWLVCFYFWTPELCNYVFHIFIDIRKIQHPPLPIMQNRTANICLQ